MKTALLIVGILATGCVIAPYDQPTDQALTSIQTRVDQHIADVASGKPTDDFYGPLHTDLHSLSIRLSAREQGDPSVQRESAALNEVSAIIDDLQSLESHATTQPVTGEAIGTAQAEFDTAIGAVLSLELRRK